jgi:hypothetical protein
MIHHNSIQFKVIVLVAVLMIATAASGEDTETPLEQDQVALLATPTFHAGFPTTRADSVELQILGSALWSGINSSAISGNYAFVTLMHGMWVLDVSTPSSPTLVAELYLGGGDQVIIKGNYAIVAVVPPISQADLKRVMRLRL